MKEQEIEAIDSIELKTNFELAHEIHQLIYERRIDIAKDLYDQLLPLIHTLKWSL